MSPVLNTWWRETCRFFANCWCWCRVDGCRIVAPIVWTFLVKMVYAMFDVDLTWLDVDCNYFHVLFFSVYKNIPNFCTFFSCALRVRFQNNKHVKLRNVVDIYYRPIYRECVENRLAQVFQRNLTTASFLTQCTLSALQLGPINRASRLYACHIIILLAIKREWAGDGVTE